MYNFHNHTYRCGHATGKDEEYVLEAIKNGYEVMGFSDHAPYLFPKGHHSGYRIQLDKAQDYANSIKALKEKYKSVIDIKLGYELEYFPALWDEEIEYLKGFEYDYLILGQHYTDNEYEPFAHYSGHETDSVAVLDKYISQVTLEFNFLGYTSHRNYPNPDVWKIIAEVGNRVVIGLDAHKPNVYSDKEDLQKATEFLADLNITPINLNELKLVNYKGEYEQF